jgi:NADH-quinone oxidoreductase subunit C
VDIAEKPLLVAFDRDHLASLVSQLDAVDAVVGAPVAKQIMNGGIVGIEVPAAKLLDVATILRDKVGFEMLTCVTGVDFVDHVQSLYHLRGIAQNWLLQVRVRLDADQPVVDSLYGIYPSANWLEREQYDLVGITYRGHPDLRRIMLDDDFEGHPLRRDFRMTPLTLHDRATTQVSAGRAIAGEQQEGQERGAPKRLGQGSQERLHPGKQTFGSAAVYLTTGQGVVEPEQKKPGKKK